MAFNSGYASPGNRDAIKVSVGGINALTGLGKDTADPPTQDYLCYKQPWLDGIAYEPGVVRQFTAVTAQDGYTIEEQLTGKVSLLSLCVYTVHAEHYPPSFPELRGNTAVRCLPTSPARL